MNIPTVGCNRAAFHEYHTSGDNFDILNFDLIQDLAEMQYAALMEMQKGKYHSTPFERIPPRTRTANLYHVARDYNPRDYIPHPLFKGFFSKHRLYVDWRENPLLNNRALDRFMINIDGQNSCQDIVNNCGSNFSVVDEYLQKFVIRGLIKL